MAGVVATEMTASGSVDAGTRPVLLGWTGQETGDVDPLEATLHAGDASGPVLGVIGSAIGEAAHPVWFGPQGVRAPGGLHLEITSGTAQVIVYWM